ncbi:hypothetical protein Ancab_039051 [Ancistrocladus abbreviatus]
MKASRVLMHLLLYQFFSVMASNSPPPSPPSVIIVGAGLSGISAAKTLHDAGIHDFLMLEADASIGGRIKLGGFGGNIIELGANWLHGVGGQKGNPLIEIAQQIKLKIFRSDYSNISSNTYRQGGGLYSKEEVEAAIKVADLRQKFGTELSKRLAAMPGIDDDMSILASQRLYRRVPVTPLEMLIDYYYYDYESAEPPRITSLKHTLPRYELSELGDASYFVADSRGLRAIVHHIAKQFLTYDDDDVITDPRLKLGQVVTKISNYSQNGVTVTAEDGSIYRAKLVIISVSVGVLQSDLIAFRPFLPHLENEMPGSNILFVVVTDEESTRIEQQPDNQTMAEAKDVLRKMFGDEIPEPSKIWVPRWKTNRFYRGAYSNWPYGYSQLRHKQLCEPIGPIYFTGEHTNPGYLAYIDAAYLAGNKTALEVIRCLENKQCEGYRNIPA